MAVTADTVQVRLEAQTSQYLRDLANADRRFTQMVQRAEQEALQAGRAFSTLGAQATAGFGQAADAAMRASSAGMAARSSFSGVAAQFQDIGVTAAMGMNPMLIALQQGTQLAAQLQVAAANGQGVFRSLATGIAGLINPISIATIATIALGTAAVQYFSTLLTDGKMSEELLKEQEDAIRAVADRWGDAVPALREYVEQLDQAKRASEEATVVEILPARIMQDARDQLGSLYSELDITIGQLDSMADRGDSFDDLLRAFALLDERMADGTATAEDMERVTAALASVIQNGGLPAVLNFANGWDVLSSSIRSALAAAADFNSQTANTDLTNAQNQVGWILEQRRLNTLTAEELALHNEINRVKASYRREFGEEIDDAQALTIATDNLAAAERRRAEVAANRPSGGGASARASTDREAEAVLKLIDGLEYELELLTMTNREQAVANALRQAGSAATAEQVAEIERLAGALYDSREAQRELNEIAQEWANTVQSAARGFIDDLLAGKDAAESLGNVLRKVADQLINMGLNSIFGGQGLNLFGMFGGFRASGGPVSSGRSYIVGERGPELFTPSSAGSIIPNNALGGGGGQIVYAPQIDARGADVAAVARLEEVMIRQQAEFDSRVKSIVRGANKNWRVK